MSDKSLRAFVMWYLIGEWVAGAVLDSRARKRIRREAELRRQGRHIGYLSGYRDGYQAAGGRPVFVAYTRRITPGDAKVPRVARFYRLYR